MDNNDLRNDSRFLMDMTVDDDNWAFASSIETALISAEDKASGLDEHISETLETLKKLTPDCDKLDYALSASCGILCGMMDIFFVGEPGDTPLGDVTDKWFKERTKDFAWQDKKIRQFAKKLGWSDVKTNGSSDPFMYLNKVYDVPYDQRGAGDAGKIVYGMTPSNHHFKSLGHNPTPVGLFYSILDQFGDGVENTSHFVANGQLITLEHVNSGFELYGKDVPSKLFCAFVNWVGHLVSDNSGSGKNKSRGMGIPSPLWCWTNDVIAIKSELHIEVTDFDKSINELALNLYERGYDARFQTAQAIPVFVNEMMVRFLYSVRRSIIYFKSIAKEEFDFQRFWKECEPFSNASVKRMLTVAHGAFCLIDAGDAAIRGVATGVGSFNVIKFCMRLNIIGIGRFTISLYGEAERAIKCSQLNEDIYLLVREKNIVDDYIEGLKCLSEVYDDSYYLTFVDDLQNSDMYKCMCHLRGQSP